MTSDPPSCAICTSPEMSAAIVREPPSIETSVTSRKFSAKMPLSFAYHCDRLSFVRLLYATLSATVAGFGVDDDPAAADVAGADVAAGAAPPHAATSVARMIPTSSVLMSHLPPPEGGYRNRRCSRFRTIVSTSAGIRRSLTYAAARAIAGPASSGSVIGPSAYQPMLRAIAAKS